MKYCPLFVSIFSLVSSVAFIMTFCTDLGVSDSPHNMKITLPEGITIPDTPSTVKTDVTLVTNGNDITSSSSAGDVDAGSSSSSGAGNTVTALTSKITVTLWWVNMHYSIPELPGVSMSTKVRFVEYYPCSAGKNLTEGMIAGIIVALALTVCNTLVSAAQLCMKKTSILRTTIHVFVTIGSLISLVPLVILVVMYLCSLCGLESLKDAGAAPRLGTAGIVIAAGLNILSLPFCFFL